MPAVNDATLLLISRSCPNLTHVDVSACGVTDHGIKYEIVTKIFS